MATLPSVFGPVVEAQAEIPAVPDIDQFIAPVGATALLDPVSVTVQSNDPPRVVDPVSCSDIEGRGAVTTVEFEEVVGATAVYALSPGNVKTA